MKNSAQKVERFLERHPPIVPVERSAVPEWNDLERFRVTNGNKTAKSGTAKGSFWNGSIIVPPPASLEQGGVERLKKDIRK